MPSSTSVARKNVPARSFAGLAALLAALLVPAHAAMAEAVDLELVLATDNSGSISWGEARLQREGVAEAFRSKEVVEAIQSGSLGKIGVVYFDWSNQFDNTIVVDWTIISDAATATGFSDALLEAPPTYGQRTSISSAIVTGMELLDTNDLEAPRRTIDISGDGPNNYGLELAPVRDAALDSGVIINGLPIITDNAAFDGRNFSPDIDLYYARCVIGGAGSFAIVAKGYADFALAIRRKLILEIAMIPPERPARMTRPTRSARSEAVLIRAAANPNQRPLPPGFGQGPTLLRPPATREQNCDAWGFGGGYGRFR